MSLAALVLLSELLTGQGRPEVAEVLQQGTLLVETGQLAAARELYQKALDSFPGDADLTFQLGMVHFRQHDWRKAAERYRMSLSLRPGMIKPLFYLAEAYFMESDLDAARDTIHQAANIAPDDPQVCQKYGEYLSLKLDTRREGLAWLQKARRLSPGLAQIDFEIGKAQFELSGFQAAVSSFEAALIKDASDGQAAFFLAESWAKLNDWRKARQYYEYALGHSYANGPSYYGEGRALVELGEPEAALAPLRRAIAMQPSLIQVHFQLAKAYRQLGRGGEARQATRLFSALTGRIDMSRELKGPEEERAWKCVKPLLQSNSEQEAIEALAKLQTSGELDRGEPHYLLGVIYSSLGRKNDALHMLRIARGRLPNSPRIAAYLGLVEVSSGDIAASEESFSSALTLDSSETLALIGLGGIRYQQERWAEAVRYLEKAKTADPGTLYLLCDAYLKINKVEEAYLTAEVIRAFASGNRALLNSLDELLRLYKAPRSPLAAH